MRFRVSPVLGFVVVAAMAVRVVSVAPAAQAAQGTASDVLAGLVVANEGSAPYSRDFFQHWIDADGDGCDTRQEVLMAESLEEPTVGAGCSVAGMWWSFADDQEWTDPSRLDIDHQVPLEEAWQSGASRWTAAQRQEFANDLTYYGSLNAITDAVNSAKGSSDPAEWMPPYSGAGCDYVTMWVMVKYRWNLTIDPAEKSAITGVLDGGCGSLAVDLPDKADAPLPSTDGDVLQPGDQLVAGEQIVSSNGDYRLVMQADGNLVIYGPHGATWASGTGVAGTVLVMQSDGNLVAYAPGRRAVWDSHTWTSAGARVRMQDDGSLVIQRTDGTSAWTSASDTAHAVLSDRLAAGGQLSVGQQLVSADRSHRLVMQGDGNLVVYRLGSPVWATGVAGAVLVMQGDGNLVVYRQGQAVWATGVGGFSGGTLVMQNDGNLVVYRPGGAAAWASKAAAKPVVPSSISNSQHLSAGQQIVSPNGQHRLLMQGDGNAVTYGPRGATWARGAAIGGSFLVMQGDGNLVIYAPDGRPVWSTGTGINAGARLVMQDDGNLVIYRTNGTPAWASLAPTAPPPVGGGGGGGGGGGTPPSKPADRDCADFSTQTEAQAWYNKYYPYYGDFANLDGSDNDGRVCESLP